MIFFFTHMANTNKCLQGCHIGAFRFTLSVWWMTFLIGEMQVETPRLPKKIRGAF